MNAKEEILEPYENKVTNYIHYEDTLDAMEEYASYKTKELENKIQSFRGFLSRK